MQVFQQYVLHMFTAIAGGSSPGLDANVTVKLSQAAFGPQNGTGFLECNFPGYGAISGLGFVQGTAPTTPLNQLTLEGAALTFTSNGTMNGTQPVAGYIVFDGSNRPVGGVAFGAPIIINGPGQQLSLPAPVIQQTPDAFNGLPQDQ